MSESWIQTGYMYNQKNNLELQTDSFKSLVDYLVVGYTLSRELNRLYRQLGRQFRQLKWSGYTEQKVRLRQTFCIQTDSANSQDSQTNTGDRQTDNLDGRIGYLDNQVVRLSGQPNAQSTQINRQAIYPAGHQTVDRQSDNVKI